MHIEARGVQRSFGDRSVLRGIDLLVPRGERVALVGPNGSGKSTLLRALMGMLRVEGQLRIEGLDPFSHRHELARQLAYVPQVAPRLGATVGEIVRTMCTLRGIDAPLVEDRGRALELAPSSVAAIPFHALSGGMKQKLLIALALSSGASLYILDEPTASLDASARARFFTMLDETAAQATVLLCSHRDHDVARFAERVVELGDGVVVRDELCLRRAS
jgi:ABC-2 type transport system ATP-binding protein